MRGVTSESLSLSLLWVRPTSRINFRKRF